MLCFLRERGECSDEEIARRLRFADAEEMRGQLRKWDIPDWLVGEEKPKKAPSEIPSSRKRVPKRKMYESAGEAEELPAAADAVPLFEMALSRFKSDIYLTKHLVEFFGEDERYYTYGVYPPESMTHRREDLPQEVWEDLCAAEDKDPATTEEIV